MISSLGARVHLLVRPNHRDALIALVRDVLGCEVRELNSGLRFPIAFVPFPDGSGFSVEFSREAPEESNGTWIEFRASDVVGVHAKLREAGLSSFRRPGSSHEYFRFPGGQIFRIIDLMYRGP